MQLITDQYRKLNENLHNHNPDYGTQGHGYADEIINLCGKFNTTDVLDYGCGKSTLADSLPFIIKRYDPAIRAYHEDPDPADIVVVTDVLEHVEPDLLENVLKHIESKTKKLVYFSVCTIQASKTLEDGRNAHICLKTGQEWFNKLSENFNIINYVRNGENFFILGLHKGLKITRDRNENGVKESQLKEEIQNEQ